MFLCHGAPQRHNHSVIVMQFLSSQNVPFYISLTNMYPIHSIEKKFISLFCKRIVGVNCFFKTLPQGSLPVFIEKGTALNLIFELIAKFLDKKFPTNLFPTMKLIQNQDSHTKKSAVFS